MVGIKYDQFFRGAKRIYIILTFSLVLAVVLFSPADTCAQNQTPDKIVRLKAVAGLQFDKVRFVVKPGATIKVILENTGEMMHNMLIVNPGTRMKVVAEAEAMGDEGLENDFIPRSPDVLAAIPLLRSGESASVILKVPDEEGAYPYVCTYTAHGLVMYGVMHVTNNPDLLPPLEEDPGVPETRRKERWAAPSAFHPYPMKMPQVTRLFMPEASPAAIAVGMEGNQSYCWDAGVCHLRYSWEGGYIDPSKPWDAKTTEFAKIVGEIYYKNDAGFPFRLSNPDSIPKPDFLGYELVDGYPKFLYTMEGIKVSELIRPAKNGVGLNILYRLENVNHPLWYVVSNEENVRIEASKGEWQGNILSLNPEQATEFTISISPE